MGVRESDRKKMNTNATVTNILSIRALDITTRAVTPASASERAIYSAPLTRFIGARAARFCL